MTALLISCDVMFRSRSRFLAPFTAALLLVLYAGCGTPRDAVTPDGASAERAPTVILVSIDGFRWDYLDRYDAPALQRMASEGVRAERMIPSFPSKTFPNHYSLVTGLYPEHHGIVANNMYDPEMDASFSLSDRAAVEDSRWWGGEPLWVTAEKQGQIAATYFWPGSETAIEGVRPTYWKSYDGSVPGEDRVEQVLDWLDLPSNERPTFITLYFSEVDHQGHMEGPDSQAVAEAVHEVDGYIGALVDGLKQRAIYDDVNVIVVSDHGMAATSSERVILLDDYIDLDDIRLVDFNPVVMLYANDGKDEAVLEQLRQAPHLQVYRKNEVPERFHFRTHARIPPIIGIADEGWTISTHAQYDPNPSRYDGGTHGYDNQLPSMGALFVAHGPAFASQAVVGPFANIHVYNLIATILGLAPAENDGDMRLVRDLLRLAPLTP